MCVVVVQLLSIVVVVVVNRHCTQQLPHLLFHGPPGTGKTSTILAIARQLYGPDAVKKKDRVLELNASDERGIDVVRNKVKDFARLAVGSGEPGFPNPPYKIIILDEADSMTTDAQNALRRTMELYSSVTRFCIICNYVSRIIEPLASRCVKVRFKPLEQGSIADRIRYICEQEKVELSPDALQRLVKLSGGDMRKAITMLQSAQRLYGQSSTGVPLSIQHLDDIGGVLPDERLVEVVGVLREGNMQQVQSSVDNLVADGYSATQVLSQLHDCIVTSSSSSSSPLSLPLDNRQKANIMESLSAADKALIDGSDEALQLMAVCAVIVRQIQTGGAASLPPVEITL
jgi:replication factor C subunit 2/4